MACKDSNPTPPAAGSGGTPMCGPTPCPLAEPKVAFHLHLDADRDGKVDDDRTGLDVWEWGKGKKGAVILCNNDGDETNTASDNTDKKINKGNDKDEIAPLVIRKDGPDAPPASWEAFLEVSAADAKRIRIFNGRASGAAEIIGPTKGKKFKLPNLSFTEKEFGMEATQYADGTWDGQVTITFTLNKGAKGTDTETGVVRVAPWMMPNHLDAATKVYVVKWGGIGTPTAVINNSRYRTELNTLVGAAGCSLVTHTEVDPWMQDCMEIGYSNLAVSTGYAAVMRAPRDRELKTYPKTLRKADFGYHEQGSLSPDTTFDSTGNLECTPPATSKAGKHYPWGRIYFGPGRPGERFDAKVAAFLRKQVVQDPIEIDTGWLAVGHVDEIISFVPAPGAKGFKLLLAGPKRAYKILRDNKASHGSSKLLTNRHFPAASGGWHSAEVTIKDFLDTGIPALSQTAAALKAFNDAAQVHIDAARATFTTELDLQPSDIIDVPILFIRNEFAPIQADALTAGMVNMVVANKHCIVPKPFGPVVGGVDLFEKDLRDNLEPLGLKVDYLDDWYEYHVNLGEVHCSSNTLRTPTHAPWWEFTP